MSNLSNDYTQLYNDMANLSTVTNLSALTDANSSNHSLSLGIKKQFTGNNNLTVSNTVDFSDLTLNDNVNIGIFSGQQLTNNSNNNTGVGYRCIRHASSSSDNTGAGHDCLSGILQLCNRNVSLGNDCLKNLSNGGNDSTCIGNNCCSDSTSINGLVCIGSNIRTNGLSNAIAIGTLPPPQFLNISSVNGLFFSPNLAEVTNNTNSKLMVISANGHAGPINLANSNGYLKYDTLTGYSYDNPSSSISYASYAYLADHLGLDTNVPPGDNIPYNNSNTFIFYGPNLRRPLDNSKYVEVLISGTYQVDVTFNFITLTGTSSCRPSVYLREYASDRNSYVPIYLSGGMTRDTLDFTEVRQVTGTFVFPAFAGQFLELYINNLSGVISFNIFRLAWKITALS